MAEKNEETPENLQEEVATAASEASAAEGGRGDERSEADAGETTAAPAAEEAAPAKAAPKGGPSRSERLEARRAERRTAAGKRPPRTAEERAAERAERRAAVAKQRRAYRARTKAKRAEGRAAAPPREADHAPEHGPGRPKVRQGVVVSDSADKTITVRIDVVRRHRRYHKILRSSVKLHAHDERNDAHPGDTVRVVECRPMSRTKRWRLVEILERAR
jgi:small subunit ribosomal protein S17